MPPIGAVIRYLIASASSRSTVALAASRRATADSLLVGPKVRPLRRLAGRGREDSVQLRAGPEETKARLGLDQPKMGFPQRSLHVVGPKLHEQVALADGGIFQGRHIDDRPQDLRADRDLGTRVGDDSPFRDDPAGRLGTGTPEGSILRTASVRAVIFLMELHVRPAATARPSTGSTTRPKNIVGDIGSSLSVGQPAVADRHDAIGDGADKRVVGHDQEPPALGPCHVAKQG